MTRVRVNNGEHRAGGNKKLNASWLRHRQTAERKLDDFKAEYLENPGVGAISLTSADKMLGGEHGRQKLQYEVKVDEQTAVESGFDPEIDLPSIYRGIPVTTQLISQEDWPRLIGGDPDEYPCFNDESLDEVPGGVVLWKSWYQDNWGTSCFPFRYNGVDYLVTANHVVGEAWEDNTGNFVYDDEKCVGQVGYSFPDRDVAYIEKSNNVADFEDVLMTPTEEKSIGGYINEIGVSIRVANLYDSNWKMGTTTGKVEGCLKNYKSDFGGLTTDYEDEFHEYKGEGIEGDSNSVGGDSGGPAYDVIDDEAWIIYMLSSSAVGAIGDVCYSDTPDMRGYSVGPAVYSFPKYSDPSTS